MNRYLMVAGAVLLLVSGWISRGRWDGQRASQLQGVADSLTIANAGYRQLAALHASIDSANAVSADSTAATMTARANLEHAQRDQLSRSLATLDRQLGQAQAAADSLPLLLAKLDTLAVDTASFSREVARKDSALVQRSIAYIDQLKATGRWQRIADSTAGTLAMLRDSVHAVSHLPAPLPQPFTNKVLRGAETAGIVLVTAEACKDHFLSLGCLAGAMVSALRVVK